LKIIDYCKVYISKISKLKEGRALFLKANSSKNIIFRLN